MDLIRYRKSYIYRHITMDLFEQAVIPENLRSIMDINIEIEIGITG